MDKSKIQYDAKIELARRSFFYYCNLMDSKFYKPSRQYLVNICNTLQQFYEGDDDVMVINCPPRHGKSYTVQMFIQWLLGKNNNNKIMTGSYNETLSETFSKNVRNKIMEEKVDKDIIVYNEIFPNTKIKKGDGAMKLWSLENSFNNYLATSPNGTATGFGCLFLIIDDIIKDAEEARNARAKEKHWDWFTNTMLSRLEEGGKILIIMTRWASDDLAGCFMEWCNSINKPFKHINYKAIQDDGSMLCPQLLSYQSAMMKKSALGQDIFSANYQQIPIDLQGRLYTEIKQYDNEPEFTSIKCYIDTADKGSDYLCAMCYGVYNQEAYIIDTVYTQEPMMITEKSVAQMLYDNNVMECYIEGNNGGEGFARQVKRILKEEYGSNRCVITTFHQSKNKEARILSNATWVMNHIYFPANWKHKWRELYDAIFSYQAEGKNAHDDAVDTLTGIVEKMNDVKETRRVRISSQRSYGIRR